MSKTDFLMPLEEKVAACTGCPLHGEGRTQTVFGHGNIHADLMFVGEAPGQNEDLQGIPFVGRAGQLLNKVLKRVGLSRSDVYIANILKCRPPGNRDPKPEEIKACTDYLREQIMILEPRVLIGLGRFSSNFLAKQHGLALSAMREVDWTYTDRDFRAWLIPTYHPASVLHQRGKNQKLTLQHIVNDVYKATKLAGQDLPQPEEEEEYEGLFE